MINCPNCKNESEFRFLKISECMNMRDTLALKEKTHKLCVKCNYLIPKTRLKND